MKRILILLAGGAVLAFSSAIAAAAHHSQSSRLALKQTSLGKILVAPNGFTPYGGFTAFVFTKDSRNKDRCVTFHGCAATWPMITTKGMPLAGTGLKSSQLSTITLPNHSKQVTYYGHPLYVYSQDGGPATIGYVGQMQFTGTWYAINAAGKMIDANGHVVK
jgi:predicted lipoprotein with Yx(FWY)xxD motif